MIVFIISGYTKPSQALGWTSLLTLLLIIPLSASFYRLIQQQRIEREIRAKLVNETITVGTGVEDTQIQVIWTTQTPTIYVTMETDKEITPNQVRLVQDFLNQRLQREFELVFFYVVPLHRITTEIPTDNPQPSDITKPTKDNIRWQIDKNNYLKPYSP